MCPTVYNVCLHVLCSFSMGSNEWLTFLSALFPFYFSSFLKLRDSLSPKTVGYRAHTTFCHVMFQYWYDLHLEMRFLLFHWFVIFGTLLKCKDYGVNKKQVSSKSFVHGQTFYFHRYISYFFFCCKLGSLMMASTFLEICLSLWCPMTLCFLTATHLEIVLKCVAFVHVGHGQFQPSDSMFYGMLSHSWDRAGFFVLFQTFWKESVYLSSLGLCVQACSYPKAAVGQGACCFLPCGWKVLSSRLLRKLSLPPHQPPKIFHHVASPPLGPLSLTVSSLRGKEAHLANDSFVNFLPSSSIVWNIFWNGGICQDIASTFPHHCWLRLLGLVV